MQQSIRQIGDLLRQGALSPVALTEDCLARIEKLNPRLNAFITVTAESARAQARQAEAEIQRGDWRGPLHGIPLALKDLIDTAGVRTTAGSSLFRDRIPAEGAEVVRRLKAAGAILLGKQNLHEFAYGGSSLVSYFGEVRNAWNVEHIAGGSSGGSATSVAGGLCYGAVGTDTAGSIREPAALCGVVGLKPTYGRVSARGVIPLSISLDHVGPIARTVADTAIILQALAIGYQYGFDIIDVTGLPSGTVYPALRRFEDAGLVVSRWEAEEVAESEQRSPRRYYELTKPGYEALAEALKRYRALENLFAVEKKPKPSDV